jgi:flagellar protein FliS
MPASPRETYLATEVHTATPSKLRWMLIDGAIRRGEAACQLWQDGNELAATNALVKCHALVGELLGSARNDDSQLAGDVVRLYTYLFRTLTEAIRDHDRQKVGHVLTVLQVERETWQQVSQNLGSPECDQSVTGAGEPAFIPPPAAAGNGQSASPRLSLDA